MSLNFEWKNVADYERKLTHPADPERMHPVCDRLVWMCMFVDIGEIKESNVEEFAWRMRLLQLVDDSADIQFNDGTKVWLTIDDVRDCIGLRTNVSTLKRKEFLKRFIENRRLVPLEQKESARVVYDRHVAEILASKEGGA